MKFDKAKKYHVILCGLIFFNVTQLKSQNAIDFNVGIFYRPALEKANRKSYQVSDKSTLLPSIGCELSYMFHVRNIRLRTGYSGSTFRTREHFNQYTNSPMATEKSYYQTKSTARHIFMQAGIHGKNKLKNFTFTLGYKLALDEEFFSELSSANATRVVTPDSNHLIRYNTLYCNFASLGIEWSKTLKERFELYTSLEGEYRIKAHKNSDVYRTVNPRIYQAFDFDVLYARFAVGVRYLFNIDGKSKMLI